MSKVAEDGARLVFPFYLRFPIHHPMRDGIAKPWGVIPPPTVPGHQRRIFQQPRSSSGQMLPPAQILQKLAGASNQRNRMFKKRRLLNGRQLSMGEAQPTSEHEWSLAAAPKTRECGSDHTAASSGNLVAADQRKL